jgi:hypothetical protein
MYLLGYGAKLPNFKLETRLRQLLCYLPLDIELPTLAILCQKEKGFL